MLNVKRFIELCQPYSMLGIERIKNIYDQTAYVCQNGIDGDWVECGVWKGGIAYATLHLLHTLDSSKSIYLYDTFEGMTEPSRYDIDLYGNTAESQKDAIRCEASFEDVCRLIDSVDVSNKTYIHRGDVRKTLLDIGKLPDKISLLHLDTDFYDSTMVELNVLWSRLSKGGVCIIDDYGHWSGCRRAVDGFFQNWKHPEVADVNKIDYTAIQIVKINE